MDSSQVLPVRCRQVSRCVTAWAVSDTCPVLSALGPCSQQSGQAGGPLSAALGLVQDLGLACRGHRDLLGWGRASRPGVRSSWRAVDPGSEVQQRPQQCLGCAALLLGRLNEVPPLQLLQQGSGPAPLWAQETLTSPFEPPSSLPPAPAGMGNSFKFLPMCIRRAQS